MGKFHPHGDASIYDAMVRMAQEFAARYPLVEGQGNFGNIDGDNPAAMRYTEARLTQVAQALLAGIDDDAVDFRPTYDGEDSEPVVLPGAFPNLLANGAAGIAVGMATSIPPHNAGEVCAAAIHLVRQPTATTAELLRHMPGPGFSHRRRAGRGRGVAAVRLRDRPRRVPSAREMGGGEGQVRRPGRSSSPRSPTRCRRPKLIEQMAQLLEEKKLPLLGDVRDESAEEVRLVLEPRVAASSPKC